MRWLALLVLAACASSSRANRDAPPEVPEVANPDELRKRAAFELACTESELKLVVLGDPATAGVSGCGKRAVYKDLGSGRGWSANVIAEEPVAPAAAGPAAPKAEVAELEALLARAEFELACPREQIGVTDLGNNGATAGVTGCGRRAVYKHRGAARGWFAESKSP